MTLRATARTVPPTPRSSRRPDLQLGTVPFCRKPKQPCPFCLIINNDNGDGSLCQVFLTPGTGSVRRGAIPPCAFLLWDAIVRASRPTAGCSLREASSFQAPIPAHFMKWVPTSRSGSPARSGLHRSRAVQPPPGPAPLPDSPSRNMALPHLGAQPVVCMASYDGLWKISGAAGNGGRVSMPSDLRK